MLPKDEEPLEPGRYFDDWLENEQKPAVNDAGVRNDKYVFLKQSCVNCHPVRGTENETPARKRGACTTSC